MLARSNKETRNVLKKGDLDERKKEEGNNFHQANIKSFESKFVLSACLPPPYLIACFSYLLLTNQEP